LKNYFAYASKVDQDWCKLLLMIERTKKRCVMRRLRSCGGLGLWGTTLVGTLLLFLFGATIYRYFSQTGPATEQQILQHLDQFTGAFKNIHEAAGIRGFEHDITPIDFLNVRSFAGSTIGGMSVEYPEKWQGPYLDNTLTIQGKPYVVVRTLQGYWIRPGDGVVLADGREFGKDIVINSSTNIVDLLKKNSDLTYQGKPLLGYLSFISAETILDLSPGFLSAE
jgi:hypothetical protein